ncbi:hypothetical protein PCE1_002204 [Barthelona sp. PCE]
MQSDESIFDLVPEIEAAVHKPKPYTSKFKKTTRKEYFSNKRSMGSMGPLKVERPNPHKFLKSKQFENRNATLRPSTGSKKKIKRKEPLPPKGDHGILAPTTEKDFIKTNIITAKTMKKGARPQSPLNWTKKPHYGEVPEYLTHVKDEIADEYTVLAQMEETQLYEDEPQLHVLGEEEKEELIMGLKSRWDEVWHTYQSLGLVSDDLESQIMRKEEHEKELDRIEAEIEMLSKPYVIVQDE